MDSTNTSGISVQGRRSANSKNCCVSERRFLQKRFPSKQKGTSRLWLTTSVGRGCTEGRSVGSQSEWNGANSVPSKDRSNEPTSHLWQGVASRLHSLCEIVDGLHLFPRHMRAPINCTNSSGTKDSNRSADQSSTVIHLLEVAKQHPREQQE